MGQRNTFPLKLCALLLVKLTNMGVTGKPDKTSPTYKMRALLFTLVPWRHTLEILRVPFRGESELRVVLRSVTLSTNQPVAGITKLSLLKEFIKNLRIIHAPGHLTQHQQKTVQVIAC